MQFLTIENRYVIRLKIILAVFVCLLVWFSFFFFFGFFNYILHLSFCDNKFSICCHQKKIQCKTAVHFSKKSILSTLKTIIRYKGRLTIGLLIHQTSNSIYTYSDQRPTKYSSDKCYKDTQFYLPSLIIASLCINDNFKQKIGLV